MALARRFVAILIASLVALAVVGAVPTIVQAQSAQEKKELSRARAQFQRGIELEQAGNWAGALELFRQVGEFKMTPQVRFHIALCEENLGKLVAAMGGYALALADADEVGVSFKAEVEQRIEDLKARIPKITIERGAGALAARIEFDGVSLGESKIGVPNPVDPGPHLIEARLSGYHPFSETVIVAEEQNKTVTIAMKKIEEPKEPAAATPTSSPKADRGVPEERSLLAPIIVGSVGVAALAAGGTFYLLRENEVADLQELCGGTDCSRLTGEQLRIASDKKDTMQSYNLLSQVSFGLGVAAIGGAVALYFLTGPDEAPKAKETTAHQRTLQVTPLLGANAAGMLVHGAF